MIRKFAAAALVAFSVMAPVTASAQDAACAADVQSGIETVRKMYVDGMGGVANSSFSSRSGSYSEMACLERFMRGDMDIFFRPPDLNSLLEQAVSFACDKIQEAVGQRSGGGFDAINAFSNIGSTGMTLPSVSPTTFTNPLTLMRGRS